MSLRTPGSILLVSCYELGHQPLGAALPLAFLERAGFSPAALDISVENFDAEKVVLARFVAISVPMHTALRLVVRVAERARESNPSAWICFYGLYAALNADYLLEHGGDFCIGGECETPLVTLVKTLDIEPLLTTHHPLARVAGQVHNGRMLSSARRAATGFTAATTSRIISFTIWVWASRTGHCRLTALVA